MAAGYRGGGKSEIRNPKAERGEVDRKMADRKMK